MIKTILIATLVFSGVAFAESSEKMMKSHADSAKSERLAQRQQDNMQKREHMNQVREERKAFHQHLKEEKQQFREHMQNERQTHQQNKKH